MPSKDDVMGIIAAIAVGILGGVALAKLLNHFFGCRCPRCGEQISYGTTPCPQCQTPLRWNWHEGINI